jgi:hypothetical protein
MVVYGTSLCCLQWLLQYVLASFSRQKKLIRENEAAALLFADEAKVCDTKLARS